MAVSKLTRFFDNQFITASNTTVSSSAAGYPFSNAVDTIRSKLWRPTSNSWSLEWDYNYPAPISFLGIIGKLGEIFTISETATLTLKAENIAASWTSPAFEQAVTPSDFGAFLQIDNSTGGYRYWRLECADTSNPTQNEIGFIYLGDHTQIEERDINRGYAMKQIDPSVLARSIDGTEYAEERQKYKTFTNLGMGYMSGSDRMALEQMFYEYGKSRPFFVSLDPALQRSTYDWELTRFVRFMSEPRLTNFSNDIFSMSFELKEAI